MGQHGVDHRSAGMLLDDPQVVGEIEIARGSALADQIGHEHDEPARATQRVGDALDHEVGTTLVNRLPGPSTTRSASRIASITPAVGSAEPGRRPMRRIGRRHSAISVSPMIVESSSSVASRLTTSVVAGRIGRSCAARGW